MVRTRVAVDGCELAVEDGGFGAPLVLLHGFPMSSAIFAPVRPAIESVGRLITPDLRGFGASDAPEGAYTMDVLADDVMAVADRLGLDRFVLGGHSMGGYVALRIAARRPEQLAGLVMIDSRAAPDTVEGAARRRAGVDTIAAGRRSEFLDGFLPLLIGPSARERSPELPDRLREMAAAVPDHVLAGCLEGMRLRPDSRPLLPALGCPALVIVGAEDPVTPPDEARALADALPQGRVKVVPNAGHTPTLERPEEAGALLADFLRELS